MSTVDVAVGLAQGSLVTKTGVAVAPAVTAVSVTLTVPANRRWLIIAGMMHNGDSVTRTMYARAATSGGAIYAQPVYLSVATGFYVSLYCNQADGYNGGFQLLMGAGDTLTLTWAAPGSGVGGNCNYAIQVIEVVV